MLLQCYVLYLRFKMLLWHTFAGYDEAEVMLKGAMIFADYLPDCEGGLQKWIGSVRPCLLCRCSLINGPDTRSCGACNTRRPQGIKPSSSSSSAQSGAFPSADGDGLPAPASASGPGPASSSSSSANGMAKQKKGKKASGLSCPVCDGSIRLTGSWSSALVSWRHHSFGL